LKDNAYFSIWEDKFRSTLRAQGLQNIYNGFQPNTPDEHTDHTAQLNWVYNILLTCILTPTGKSIVLQHRNDADASTVLNKLKNDATISVSGKMRLRALLFQIGTTRIDCTKYARHQAIFLINFSNLIIDHNRLCPKEQIIGPAMCKEYTITAVKPADNLDAIQIREYENTVGQGFPPYSYETYLHCLEVAAAVNDGLPVTTPRRRANLTDLSSDPGLDEQDAYLDHGDDHGELSAYAASSRPRSETTRPRLPGELYGQLSPNGRQSWNKFTDTDRSTIIGALSANTHQLGEPLDDQDSDPPDDDVDPEDIPPGELSINQARQPRSKPPARPVADTHPADPRRMLSQSGKTRPSATTPPGDAPTRKVKMARFAPGLTVTEARLDNSIGHAIADYWGDNDHEDDHYFDAVPDFC